ncbi:MAG TPA: hypothetical protein VF884_16175 [Nitrososphaeraceae archaeon]
MSYARSINALKKNVPDLNKAEKKTRKLKKGSYPAHWDKSSTTCLVSGETASC